MHCGSVPSWSKGVRGSHWCQGHISLVSWRAAFGNFIGSGASASPSESGVRCQGYTNGSLIHLEAKRSRDI